MSGGKPSECCVDDIFGDAGCLQDGNLLDANRHEFKKSMP